MNEVVLGIDIGGTKVAAGLVNAAGKIQFKTRVPMSAAGSAAEAMGCVHAAIRAVFDANPKRTWLNWRSFARAARTA